MYQLPGPFSETCDSEVPPSLSHPSPPSEHWASTSQAGIRFSDSGLHGVKHAPSHSDAFSGSRMYSLADIGLWRLKNHMCLIQKSFRLLNCCVHLYWPVFPKPHSSFPKHQLAALHTCHNQQTRVEQLHSSPGICPTVKVAFIPNYEHQPWQYCKHWSSTD